MGEEAGMSSAGAAAQSMVFSALQSGFGAYQYLRGQRLYNKYMKNRPTYNIPTATVANVNLAKESYAQGMPGYDIARNQINSSLADAMSRAEDVSASSLDLLGASTDMYSQQLNALNSLALNRAINKSQALGQLMSANQALSAEQSKQFEYNKWIPWQMKLNRQAERMNFGMSMLGSGLSNMQGTASNYMQSQATMDQLNKIYGNQNDTGQPTSMFTGSGYWNIKR